MPRRHPLWIAIALWSSLALVAEAAPSARPSVMLAPYEGLYGFYEHRLADALAQRLAPIRRFRLVAEPEARSGAMNEGTSRAIARAREAEAEVAVLLAFDQDPQAQYIRFGDLNGHFVAASHLEVRVIDVSTGKDLFRRILPYYGDSPGSREQAEAIAFEQVLNEIARILQDTFPVSATLVHRSGRDVTLDGGEATGLQPEQFLAGKDAHGVPVGRVRVTQVASDSANGEILQGYYELKEGDRLVEQAYASAPGAALLVRTEWLTPAKGSFTGLRMENNRSGVGWSFGLDFGQQEQDGVSGLALAPHAAYPFEWIPEHLWATLEAGIAGTVLSQSVPDNGSHATGFSLHATLGANVQGNWNGLAWSLGVEVWSPWQVTQWNRSSDSGPTTDVSNLVHAARQGGIGPRLELGWSF